MSQNLPHLDTAATTFFMRELERILTEQFDVKRPALMGKKLCPVRNEFSPEDETYTYRRFDMYGSAKRMKDMSDNLPTVNVAGDETSNVFMSYGASFQYSIDELRASAKYNRPLDTARALAARKMVDLQVDEVIANGDSGAGFEGLLNLSNTDAYTVPSDGASSGQTWDSKIETPDLIIRDMNGMISQVKENTKGTESPTRIVLPIHCLELITNTPRSATTDTTILKFFLDTHPGLEVMSWERLSTSGFAYTPSPSNLWVPISIEFEQQAPQLRNMAYVVNCRAKMGGVVSPYPKSFITAAALDA